MSKYLDESASSYLLISSTRTDIILYITKAHNVKLLLLNFFSLNIKLVKNKKIGKLSMIANIEDNNIFLVKKSEKPIGNIRKISVKLDTLKSL